MTYAKTSLAVLLGMAIGSSLTLIVQFPTVAIIDQRKTLTVANFVQDTHSAHRVQAPVDYSEFHGPARAYTVWKHGKSAFTCVPERPGYKPVGNLFIGPPKAASSTTGGIMLRISRNIYRRAHDNQVNETECKVTQIIYPYPASMYGYRNRDKQKSFLWSFLREPTSRFVSEFFHFGVSRKGLQPTDANFRWYLKAGSNQNNLYIYNLHPRSKNHMLNATKAVEEILDEYNFIGITERMHESLVVLKLLLGLEMNDILYVKSSKKSGGFDDGVYNNSCIYIVKSFVSPGMQEFFASDQVWKDRSRGDIMLYRAANKSLDMTIDALGRDVVEQELQEYERAMQVAQETCQDVKLPCTPGGKRRRTHDCLYWDLACGYKCLENLETSTE